MRPSTRPQSLRGHSQHVAASFPISGLGTQLFPATLLPVSDDAIREPEFHLLLRSQSGDWERKQK